MATSDPRRNGPLSGWAGWLLNTVAVLSAGGAYVLSALAGDASASRQTWLLVAGSLLAAAVVACGAFTQRRDARRIRAAEQVAGEAQEALTTALNGALAPITSYLGEVTGVQDRRARAVVAGKLRQAVVDAAVLLNPPAARSAFYRYDADHSRLVREAYAGRSSLPRDEFIAGTADGDTVLDLVDRGDLVFVDDVSADPLVTPTATGDYNTVIAVAVTASGRPLGMLTVDSPLTGELSATDAELMRVLANLLGAGLAGAG